MNQQTILDFANRANSLSHFETNNRFPPSKYYNFLRVAVQGIEAKLAVELGVCGGGGSYHMALQNKNCHVIGVDMQIEYPQNIEFIEKSCDNFTFVLSDSIEAINKVLQLDSNPIDLLFIDTDHTYNQTKIEFESWLPLMSSNGNALICMDDLNREGVREYWNEIEFPKIELPKLHIGGSKTDGSFGVVWGL